MTRPDWPQALARVLRAEGGYVDHPLDPGGATNMGITRRTLARWRKVAPWWRLPKSAVRTLGRSEAERIYKSLYWDRCAGDRLPAGLDLAVFDFAVNSGPQRAVKTLQKLVGARPDGIIGDLTMSALRKRIAEIGIAGLIDALCGKRLGFLQRLSAFAVFGRGWRARVEEVRRAARALAGAPQIPKTVQPRRETMDILSGYKTYIVALAMLLAGITQLAGIDVPSFDGQSAGQLIVQALAVIFLRKGIKAVAGGK